MILDWSLYPHFTEAEMRCKVTGKVDMDPLFMATLEDIRAEFGKPMLVTSGFRAPEHPTEARKRSGPGEHSFGRAADIAVRGGDALLLVQVALAHGIRRIGVNQKGTSRFLHLGMGGPGLPSPMIWSY